MLGEPDLPRDAGEGHVLHHQPVHGVQGQVRAEPMTLVNGKERLRLEFDCRACEMHVIGRMRKQVAASPPPTALPGAPLVFHRRRAVPD